MNDLDNCPHCGVSLIGEMISPRLQPLYGATHFKREIGVEYPGKYDGVWEWQCPDCNKTWPSEVAKLRSVK